MLIDEAKKLLNIRTHMPLYGKIYPEHAESKHYDIEYYLIYLIIMGCAICTT
jgi:hypothetical protein